MFYSYLESEHFINLQPTDMSYEMHQLIWSLFSYIPYYEKREFIYFLFHNKIFIMSKTIPLSNLPENEFTLITKPYELQALKGMLFQFEVRINALVCRENKKISIIGAYSKDFKDDLEYNFNKISHLAIRDWFNKRIDKLGFIVLDHVILSYQSHYFRKRNNKKITFSSVDVHGLLQVINPDLFLKSYYEGIGRSRAFGCGLMLLSPIKNIYK